MIVPRYGAALFLLLSLSLIGTGFVRAAGTPRTQRPVKDLHWMNSPRSTLVEAARRGYEGSAPSPLILYEDSEAACRRAVVSISIATPVHLAQEIGFRRKENSDTPPEKAHIKPAVRRARVRVTFGSTRASEPVKIGIAHGGWTYEPKKQSLESTTSVQCGETEIFLHTVTVLFRGEMSLPREGRAMFLIRKKRGARYGVPVSFDSLQ